MKSTAKTLYKFIKRLDTEEEYRQIADDLMEFAQKEDTYDISRFPLSLMISPPIFLSFRDHSEYFSNAYDNALRIIGTRIKQHGLEGKIDRHLALEMLPFYDPEYRAYLKEKRSKEDENNADIDRLRIENCRLRGIMRSHNMVSNCGTAIERD